MGLREDKKLATWREIRRVALDLFARDGFEQTTVEQIAQAAGVSRATFFNYFSGKEAVVFDEDPEERERWQQTMATRPPEESLWEALTAVLLEFSESLRDRMPIQRRLKATSPHLAQITENFGARFRSDLHTWAAGREPGPDPLDRSLQVNIALTSLGTAYQTWPADEDFDDYLDRVRRCLTAAAPRPT